MGGSPTTRPTSPGLRPEPNIALDAEPRPFDASPGSQRQSRPARRRSLPAVARMRMIKDEDEIETIRQAVALCDLGQEVTRRSARPDISEIELFGEVRKAMEAQAGVRLLLLADMASGARPRRSAALLRRDGLSPETWCFLTSCRVTRAIGATRVTPAP